MIAQNIQNIQSKLPPEVKLVAVSKFHPLEAIQQAYEAGLRCFAESRPQELQKKIKAIESGEVSPMPGIEWHFIGHLQTNKLKMVLPYADLVQSVDSLHLLDEINAWALKNQKRINLLLELHIGAEETKQGFVEEEILDLLFRAEKYKGVNFCGLMGMASNTDNEEDIRADFGRISYFFNYLQELFPELESFKELSIGMSDDWHIAVEYGASMVRIGTTIFGPREY